MINSPMKFVVDQFNPLRIYLIGEDDREVFELEIRDGHTIKVCSGNSTIKDKEKLYDWSFSVVPISSGSILISRNECLL